MHPCSPDAGRDPTALRFLITIRVASLAKTFLPSTGRSARSDAQRHVVPAVVRLEPAYVGSSRTKYEVFPPLSCLSLLE